ncbi:hypothetical protein C2E23DRAFT_800851 [Lenzites betulinus]|nr:hypothetical protein C2E23DRAFT_800851 [Lenzites betulinus]
MQSDQLLHDRVNLARLVRRLEKTVSNDTWPNEVTESASIPAWITTRRTLQKVKHARKLLQAVESNEDASDSSSSRQYGDYRQTLDRLEKLVVEADKRYSPRATRPEPILPSIPPPQTVVELPSTDASAQQDPSTTLLPAEPTPSSATHELLLSPSESVPTIRGPLNPAETLLPPSLPASVEKSAVKGTPAFLQNSAALHDELSAQLAQMATQLKRNALHFSDALEKDKAVVEDAQEKLERNHDVMSKERVRLRDHHSKSWGTTWITLLSIVVALIAFILTFLVIRFT